MATRLFVGNLSYRVTEPELKQVFEEGGRNVVEVKIVKCREARIPEEIRPEIIVGRRVPELINRQFVRRLTVEPDEVVGRLSSGGKRL